ncbi:hypothetical protein J2853_005143 [Streptosporangium lutulentum]|uniref:Uncharacterized protein n=1 Tax=Streptosporangium lutulentum TaxID=1461250 RepID=A0ABT9QGW4_9ACTN|nr:hypothetical protein [Streptosporangium lutulentum]
MPQEKTKRSGVGGTPGAPLPDPCPVEGGRVRSPSSLGLETPVHFTRFFQRSAQSV